MSVEFGDEHQFANVSAKFQEPEPKKGNQALLVVVAVVAFVIMGVFIYKIKSKDQNNYTKDQTKVMHQVQEMMSQNAIQ